jgi:Flp pilus assembly protein TadD/predicted phosphodiesterase/energy-coupling factor transporter ATP-binding protein EcfA2
MAIHWLHLSDIHFHGKDNWRDERARGELLAYLREMFKNDEFARPDLVFCTGDIAFGETGAEGLQKQYESAKTFFADLLKVCGAPGKPLAVNRLFVVPGNHDINRKEVDEDAQAALVALAQDSRNQMARINSRLETKPTPFTNAMKRLAAYEAFVKDFLPHQVDKEGRCVYAKVVTVGSVKLGIAGFNSAWSCAGPEDDRNLWLGAEWQFNRAQRDLAEADIRLGLIHHPIDWLNEAEREVATRRIARDFDFWLHGHAHNAWVEALGNHVRIGAVGAGTSDEFGVNLVRLGGAGGVGRDEVHLHQFKDGWTIQPIAGQAPRGIWVLTLPERLQKLRGKLLIGSKAIGKKYTKIGGDENDSMSIKDIIHSNEPCVQIDDFQPCPAFAQVQRVTHNPGPAPTHQRPQLFGRADLLKQCAQKLQQKSILLLYGLRGNGKSALLDALDSLPPLAGKTRLRLQALPETGANDIFRALAWSLGEMNEYPQAPQGDAKAIAAQLLKNYPQPAKPVYLHLDRAHTLLNGQAWRDGAVRQLLLGLQLAYGDKLPLVLELRERAPGLLGSEANEVEVPGLDRTSMGDMLAAGAPPGMDWTYKGDELKRLYGWIGAGNGKTAHPLTLTLLIEVARGLGQRPKDVLARHSVALEQKIEEKLLNDLYSNVLNENEQAMLETLALYRSHIHHDHADWLETKLELAGGWDGLNRRYLLASDAEGEKFYLHSFIAAWLRKRQGYAGQDEAGGEETRFADSAAPLQQALVRRRHMAIAECWLQQLGQGKRRTQLNIDRALEAFHHLLAAGAGERVQEVAVEFLSGKLDWALKKIQRFNDHLFQSGAPMREQAKALEYWLALDPQEHKAWRFLGECHTKMEGRRSAKALHCFEQACQLLPGYPRYWANLGRAMREHGPDSARAFLHKLEQVERDYPQAIDNHVQAVRADCQKIAGDAAAGRKTRQTAIAAGSDHAAFHAEEAKALHAEGQSSAALALLQQAKQLGIDNDVTRAIEADILQATGRGQEAQAQRLAQIAAGTTNPALYNDAALAMLAAGDAQGALHLLQQAQARGVGDDFTVAIYANALQQNGQADEAMAVRQQKIDGNSRNVVFYNDQANSHYQRGDYASALAVLDLAQQRGLRDQVTDRIRAKTERKLHA